MTVRVYRSTDAGAPTFNNAPGNVTALLKACLVTGYGSKPAAGWTNPYSGSNVEVFRQGAGNLRYLWVDDSLPSSTYPYQTLYRGFEVMGSASVGSGGFPSSTQPFSVPRSSGGSVASTPHGWALIATEKFFYFFWGTSPATSPFSYPRSMCFGDYISYLPGDLFNTMLIAAPYGEAYSTVDRLSQLATGSVASSNSMPGHTAARKWDGTGGAFSIMKHTDSMKSPGGMMGVGAVQYPNPVDGGVYLAKIMLHEYQGAGQGVIRGEMPGLWTSCHPVGTFNHGDTFDGDGDFAGKRFEVWKYGSSGNDASVVIEISDTW